MDEEFFKTNQVGFRFLRIDLLAENVGVAEGPLRFMLGIFLGIVYSVDLYKAPSCLWSQDL